MKTILRSTVLVMLALSLGSCAGFMDGFTLTRLSLLPSIGSSRDADLESMDAWARTLGWSGSPLADRKAPGEIQPHLVRLIDPSTLKAERTTMATSLSEAVALAKDVQPLGPVAIVPLESFWPDRDWPTPAPGVLSSLRVSQKAKWFFSVVAADFARRFESVDFRRAFTVFLTDRLAEEWLESHGAPPLELAQFQDLEADRAVFWQLSGDLVAQLRSLGEGDHSADERKSLTTRLMNAWRKNFSSEYNVRFRTSAYAQFSNSNLDLTIVGQWWDYTPLLQQLRSRWIKSGSTVTSLLETVASWPDSQRDVP